MRLRITSVATSIVLLTALSMPALVGVMTMVELFTTSTLKSRWPVRPAPWVSGRMRSTAASTCDGLRTMKLNFPSRLEMRSEEHTSELQSLMRISYAVFCLKKKKTRDTNNEINYKETIYSEEQTKTTINIQEKYHT